MSENEGLKMSALTVDELVIVLAKMRSMYVTAEKIKKDIEDGFPVNDDGTINYLKYMSWGCMVMKK